MPRRENISKVEKTSVQLACVNGRYLPCRCLLKAQKAFLVQSEHQICVAEMVKACYFSGSRRDMYTSKPGNYPTNYLVKMEENCDSSVSIWEKACFYENLNQYWKNSEIQQNCSIARRKKIVKMMEKYNSTVFFWIFI